MKMLVLSIALLVSVNALAGPYTEPEPDLGPTQVVSIQLEALKRNDEPIADSGIEQTWAFAHPANRQATGPLPRFTRMLKSTTYQPLLGHRSHDIELLERNSRKARFLVTVQTADSRAVRYEWTVERVAGGEYDGCWMTTGVSAPEALGPII